MKNYSIKNISEFMLKLFDDEATAYKAAEIGKAILSAQSLRLTDIAAKMSGKTQSAAYKRIQRFVSETDPREVLWRLFQEQAEFVIGDPTEIERPQARKTEYVGTLKDKKTRGFWVLVLATPYRGRAIPCGVMTYSSKTISAGLDSRNLNHFRLLASLKDLLGDRPLVLDREFSYLELLERLVAEALHFVIRLNLGRHPPKFVDSEGREVSLTISPGETVVYQGVWYKGRVCVNVIGRWKRGLGEPLWVMTNLAAEAGLRIYQKRMKIEEAFRDLKNLLGMDKLMNKKQTIMEKMVALLLMVYAIGLLLGERLRDYLYGKRTDEQQPASAEASLPGSPLGKRGEKWKRYSGLFLLLKQKWSLPSAKWQTLFNKALADFTNIVHHPVRTHV